MKKFVIVEHTIFLHEEKMKKICLLSMSCLLLSGCFSSADDYEMYAQNNLRAPTRPPVENKIEHKNATITIPSLIVDLHQSRANPIKNARTSKNKTEPEIIAKTIFPPSSKIS